MFVSFGHDNEASGFITKKYIKQKGIYFLYNISKLDR